MTSKKVVSENSATRQKKQKLAYVNKKRPYSRGRSITENNNQIRAKQIKYILLENLLAAEKRAKLMRLFHDVFKQKRAPDDFDAEVVETRQFRAISPAYEYDYSADSRNNVRQVDELAIYDDTRREFNHFFVGILACISLQVVLDAPVIALENGGWFFLIPFTVVYVFVVMPMFILDIALGQFTSAHPASIFARICPMFSGIAVLMTIIRWLRLMFIRLNPMQLLYLTDTFYTYVMGQHSPTCYGKGIFCPLVRTCDSKNSSIVPIAGFCLTIDSLPNEMSTIAEGRSFSLHGPENPVYYLAIMHDRMGVYLLMYILSALFLGAMSLYLSRCNIRRLSIVSFLSLAYVALVMLALCVYVLQYADRVSLQLNNTYTRALTAKAWMLALVYAFELVGIGDGLISVFGSSLQFHANSLQTSFAVLFVAYGMVILSFTTLAPIISLVSVTNPIMVFEPLWSRNAAIFTILRATARIPDSAEYIQAVQMTLVLAMMIFALVNGAYQFKCIVGHRVLASSFPFLKKLPAWALHHYFSTFIICVAFYLYFFVELDISMHWLFFIMKTSILPCCVICECVAVAWCYGSKRLFINMKTMYGRSKILCRVKPLLNLMWLYFIPIICVLCWLAFFREGKPLSLLLDKTMLFFLTLFFLILFKKIVLGVLDHSIIYLVTPMPNWGPLNLLHRQQALEDEHAALHVHYA